MKLFLFSFFALFTGVCSSLDAVELSQVMPLEKDYVSMWWRDGFSKHGSSGRHHRWIQSGSYAFVLDTDELIVPFWGLVTKGVSESELNTDRNPVQPGKSPADLKLKVRVDGKDYFATQGGEVRKHGGPRLIESGRFLQRADVTDLVFQAKDETILNADARFETVAWPDQVNLRLFLRPSLRSGLGGKEQSSQFRGGKWKEAELSISLTPQGQKKSLEASSQWSPKKKEGEWQEVMLSLDPVRGIEKKRSQGVSVEAREYRSEKKCPVVFEENLGAHVVQLDHVNPLPRPKGKEEGNDVLERVKVVVSNSSEQAEVARLIFEKKKSQQSQGSWITGLSLILRAPDGTPLGVPVQLSKNWHRDAEAGSYQGNWFHGITQLRMPPKSRFEFEVTLCYGHWGGVPAASHAQLSLIGWGQNQLWEESALGSWGESICYDPSQSNAECFLTDARPMMVTPKNRKKKWAWTNNVGGGDFFRLFSKAGERIRYREMRAERHRVGPCLTEVTYSGKVGEQINHELTASLARTDDVVRGVYQIRMEVMEEVDFSRLVLFQVGSDTYLVTSEGKFAVGDEDGLRNEWKASWGGNVNRTEPVECEGRIPWVSLHEAQPMIGAQGALANRGLIIRSWKARLGGEKASPWVVEYGSERGRKQSSTIDLVPPPRVTRLQKGDFVEATLELVILPQFEKDYYGPNRELSEALSEDENTWRLVAREAQGNERKVKMRMGTLVRTTPDVRVMVEEEQASLVLRGGLGFVPVTFTGLSSPFGHELRVDGRMLEQSVHGRDFWQSDYDSSRQTWSLTFNVPARKVNQRLQLQSSSFP